MKVAGGIDIDEVLNDELEDFRSDEEVSTGMIVTTSGVPAILAVLIGVDVFENVKLLTMLLRGQSFSPSDYVEGSILQFPRSIPSQRSRQAQACQQQHTRNRLEDLHISNNMLRSAVCI